MTEIVNTAQAQAWNGYEGEHWADNDDRFDRVNGGFNAALLAAAGITAEQDVLDIGCGNGQVTRLAARQARHASGVDLSLPMLAKARARATEEGVGNVDFYQGDVQVYPFEPASLDVALSRFGVMFFADPVAAFANVHRALRPSGRLAFLCLSEFENSDMGAVFAALSPYLPRPTGERNTGPTSFADPVHTTDVLTRAGFHDVTCTAVPGEQWYGRDVPDAAGFLAAWGPVRYHLDQASPADAAAAKAALADVLARFAGPDGVVLRGSPWLVTAFASARA